MLGIAVLSKYIVNIFPRFRPRISRLLINLIDNVVHVGIPNPLVSLAKD